MPPNEKDIRQAIIEAAERLYRKYGFQKTTVADIARELHMSPANVFRFFASKSEINEAVWLRRPPPEEPEAIIHPRGGSPLGSSDGAAEKVPIEHSKGGS